MAPEIDIIHVQIPAGCGLACLAYACSKLKGNYPDQVQLGKVVGFSELNGTSWQQMLDGALHLGLSGEWVQSKTLDQLQAQKALGAVVILNWMAGRDQYLDGHYSVLKMAKPETIELQDPEFPGSLRILRRPVFEQLWFDLDMNGVRFDRAALILKQQNQLTEYQKRIIALINAKSAIEEEFYNGRITRPERDAAIASLNIV